MGTDNLYYLIYDFGTTEKILFKDCLSFVSIYTQSNTPIVQGIYLIFGIYFHIFQPSPRDRSAMIGR